MTLGVGVPDERAHGRGKRPPKLSSGCVVKGLRKAIDAARALAFKLPTGTGGSAGFALVAMRGMLPVLPPLTEPPFDDAETSDRAVFIREWDLRQRSLARERLTDREMAVVTLLWGFRPLDTFSALSRRKPDGWSVVELIAEEAKRVARVRENSK